MAWNGEKCSSTHSEDTRLPVLISGEQALELQFNYCQFLLTLQEHCRVAKIALLLLRKISVVWIYAYLQALKKYFLMEGVILCNEAILLPILHYQLKKNATQITTTSKGACKIFFPLLFPTRRLYKRRWLILGWMTRLTSQAWWKA